MVQSAAVRIGRRLKEVRDRLGLTLTEAAGRMGFNNYQTLSEIEKGARALKAWELSKLADLYSKDIWFFLQEGEPELTPNTYAWRKADATTDTRELEAGFDRLLENYHLLEEVTGEINDTKFEPWDMDAAKLTRQVVEKLANDFITDYNLGYRPAANIIDVIEKQLGIKVLFVNMGQQGSAVSTHGKHGCAIIVNSSEAPWRCNYNLAHELFHLFTGSTHASESPQSTHGPDSDDIEKLADAFAAALLMPQVPVLREAERRIQNGRISLLDLARIAVDFDVSSQALMYRLAGLRKLDWDQVKTIVDSEEFAAENRKARQGTFRKCPEFSNRFVGLGLKALQEGRISIGKFCKIFGITRSGFPDFLSAYGFSRGVADERDAALAYC